MQNIEHHPLQPFLPKNARVLFLGSFPPPQKRWSIPFFYPNYINDHWRLEGQVFYEDRDRFVDARNKCFLLDRILEFVREKGIAFYDTASAVCRLNNDASDKFLEIVEPTDIRMLMKQLPNLRVIAVTGEKATVAACENLGIEEVPRVGSYVPIPTEASSSAIDSHIVLYRLPSSSRAYPLAFDKKVEAYRKMFAFAGMVG